MQGKIMAYTFNITDNFTNKDTISEIISSDKIRRTYANILKDNAIVGIIDIWRDDEYLCVEVLYWVEFLECYRPIMGSELLNPSAQELKEVLDSIMKAITKAGKVVLNKF